MALDVEAGFVNGFSRIKYQNSIMSHITKGASKPKAPFVP